MQTQQITPSIAVAARQELGLSQAMVSRQTGINRAYLSDFEGGKRLLADRQLGALFDYFVGEGWIPDDAAEAAIVSKPEISMCGEHAIADGFVLAAPAVDSELEALLEEYYRNEDFIASEMANRIQRGILGGIDQADARQASIAALSAMARQYQIVQILHGRYQAPNKEIDWAKRSTVQTVGDYVHLLAESASKRALELQEAS